jgi:preprotein translocase subunit YajC
MTMLFALTSLLADGAPAAGEGAAGGAGASGFPIMMVVVMVAFFYFIMYLPAKRERKRQAALLGAIKKNDKVVTASGIYGVVTDVSKETNKVTLRIDESTGAKMRMDLTAVVRVLGDEPAADSSK